MAEKAKLFKNGRSQAVRLPKKFRFEGEEVKIWRSGRRVILEPVEKEEWPVGFWKMFSKDKDFPVPDPLPSSPVTLD